MIALPDPTSLEPRARHALACLVDAAGLPVAEGAAAGEAVRLVIDPGGRDDAPTDALLDLRVPPELRHSDGAVRLPHAWLAWRRPVPLFLPPPVSLFTVAHARPAAVCGLNPACS